MLRYRVRPTFTPLLTPKTKIWKKCKKHWEIFSFFICVPKASSKHFCWPTFFIKDCTDFLHRWWLLKVTFLLFFFKACVCYFLSIFIDHQTIALQKVWTMFFISSKEIFSFSRYSSICIFVFPSFSSCQPLL